MTLRRHIAWLQQELPELVRAGVLDEESGERVRQHYEEVCRTQVDWRGTRLLVTLFAVLGAVLVGAGLILLVAHNWDDLSRIHKLAISLLPLLACQGLAIWVVRTRSASLAWSEGVGAAWTLALCTTLALVDQTYHLGGSWEDLVLRWLLLTLPILYLLRATVPALVYICGSTAWLLATAWPRSPETGLYWLLVLAILPLLWRSWRDPSGSRRAALLLWTFGANLLVVPPAAFRHLLPELWLVASALLFAVLILADLRLTAPIRPDGGNLARPLRTCGLVGLVVYGLSASYPWGWDDVGRRLDSYRLELTTASAAELGVMLALVLLLAGLTLLREPSGRRRLDAYSALALAPTLLGLAYGLVASTGSSLLATLPVNGMLAGLGATMLVLGVRRDRLLVTNAGLAVLSATILVRFFDSEVELVLRGLVFLGLGLALLSTNVVLLRRRGAHS